MADKPHTNALIPPPPANPAWAQPIKPFVSPLNLLSSFFTQRPEAMQELTTMAPTAAQQTAGLMVPAGIMGPEMKALETAAQVPPAVTGIQQATKFFAGGELPKDVRYLGPMKKGAETLFEMYHDNVTGSSFGVKAGEDIAAKAEAVRAKFAAKPIAPEAAQTVPPPTAKPGELPIGEPRTVIKGGKQYEQYLDPATGKYKALHPPSKEKVATKAKLTSTVPVKKPEDIVTDLAAQPKETPPTTTPTQPEIVPPGATSAVSNVPEAGNVGELAKALSGGDPGVLGRMLAHFIDEWTKLRGGEPPPIAEPKPVPAKAPKGGAKPPTTPTLSAAQMRVQETANKNNLDVEKVSQKMFKKPFGQLGEEELKKVEAGFAPKTAAPAAPAQIKMKSSRFGDVTFTAADIKPTDTTVKGDKIVEVSARDSAGNPLTLRYTQSAVNRAMGKVTTPNQPTSMDASIKAALKGTEPTPSAVAPKVGDRLSNGTIISLEQKGNNTIAQVMPDKGTEPFYVNLSTKELQDRGEARIQFQAQKKGEVFEKAGGRQFATTRATQVPAGEKIYLNLPDGRKGYFYKEFDLGVKPPEVASRVQALQRKIDAIHDKAKTITAKTGTPGKVQPAPGELKAELQGDLNLLNAYNKELDTLKQWQAGSKAEALIRVRFPGKQEELFKWDEVKGHTTKAAADVTADTGRAPSTKPPVESKVGSLKEEGPGGKPVMKTLTESLAESKPSIPKVEPRAKEEGISSAAIAKAQGTDLNVFGKAAKTTADGLRKELLEIERRRNVARPMFQKKLDEVIAKYKANIADLDKKAEMKGPLSEDPLKQKQYEVAGAPKSAAEAAMGKLRSDITNIEQKVGSASGREKLALQMELDAKKAKLKKMEARTPPIPPPPKE